MRANNHFCFLILAFSLVCASVGAATYAHKVQPLNSAKTAQEEWERVRHNTAITSAPTIGKSFVTRGVYQGNGVPYEHLYFPVTGYDDPGCGDITKCNQWDWANHTLQNVENPHFDYSLAGHQPAWVKNMTFIPNFTCYDGNWLKWGGATTSQFQDPIPPGHFVVQVAFTLQGTFVCEAPNTQFNIILQSDPISTQPITINSTDYPQDCSCQVCASNFTYVTPVYKNGIQSYLYGEQNRIYIIPLNGSLCLNNVEAKLYYMPKVPLADNFSPSSGPREGGTSISFTIDNYDIDSTYFCHLPTADMIATPLEGNPGALVCLTPDPVAISEGRYLLEIFSTAFPDTAIGSKLFTVYNQPSITKISPSSINPGENITISGTYLSIHNDLVWYCRIGGILSTFATSSGSTLLCSVPLNGLALNAEIDVEVSLNGQNWSNKAKLFVADPTPKKRWFDMPTLLYILLGAVGGLLVIFLTIFITYRVCRNRRKKTFDEAENPLLEPSYGPRAPNPAGAEFSTMPTEFEKIDVSKITLGKRIGKGSFGEVYVGTYLGTEVAVKKILTNKISPEFMQEFAREAALMRELRHPNVVQFIGATMDEPDICIVTEYMSKGSLYHLLHDPNVSISWELVRKIALDAARGMAYLHLRTPAVIHRDLKSHNLLVDDNWKVKVCDFGLSKIAVDMQATMTACGTPCWTAPEILRNARYTTKADVFSYGIVLWELVTRDEPFAGMPAFQVIFAVGTKGVRLPLPTVCPPELIKLILSCWQEDPSLRPPFSDIITYLERISFASN